MGHRRCPTSRDRPSRTCRRALPLVLPGSPGQDWRPCISPDSPPRGWTCQEEQTPSTSPPSGGYLSHGLAKTCRASDVAGPSSPSSPSTATGRAPSWLSCIIYATKAGTASGCALTGPVSCGPSGSRLPRSRRSPRLGRRCGRLRSSITCAPRTAGSLTASSTCSPGGDPGEVRFDEVKISRDYLRESQRKFAKLALDLGHRREQFTMIKGPEDH